MLKSVFSPSGLSVLLTTVTIVKPVISGNLCFGQSHSSDCNIKDNLMCCTDWLPGYCCWSPDVTWCQYGGANNLAMTNTVRYYNNHECQGDGYATCLIQTDTSCCGGFIQDPSPAECSISWTYSGSKELSIGGGGGGGGNCSEPDMLTYTDGAGKIRKAFIPQGKAKEASKLLRDEDWHALSKFEDHKRGQ